jgi:hypothetical protein
MKYGEYPTYLPRDGGCGVGLCFCASATVQTSFPGTWPKCRDYQCKGLVSLAERLTRRISKMLGTRMLVCSLLHHDTPFSLVSKAPYNRDQKYGSGVVK